MSWPRLGQPTHDASLTSTSFPVFLICYLLAAHPLLFRPPWVIAFFQLDWKLTLQDMVLTEHRAEVWHTGACGLAALAAGSCCGACTHWVTFSIAGCVFTHWHQVELTCSRQTLLPHGHAAWAGCRDRARDRGQITNTARTAEAAPAACTQLGRLGGQQHLGRSRSPFRPRGSRPSSEQHVCHCCRRRQLCRPPGDACTRCTA